MNLKKVIGFYVLMLITSTLFAQAGRYHLLVGTYTSPGKSEGIYVYEFNTENGEMTYKSKVILEIPVNVSD